MMSVVGCVQMRAARIMVYFLHLNDFDVILLFAAELADVDLVVVGL